ncbi:hypothetical protein GJ496_006590 [Pomphorhynchus laevis]|nr:hypothetical protein GJ496_006590 [Pomphorhynchus laevis]
MSLVVVNVYDIPSPKFNRFMSAAGLSGIYHSALQVYGKEWTFVGHPFNFSGILCTNVANNEEDEASTERLDNSCLNLMDVVIYGDTKYSEEDVELIVLSLGVDRFRGCNYNLVSNNCNHFSECFLKALLSGAVMPKWVNKLARISRPFGFIDKILCDKVRRGHFILELLYIAFLGDVDAIRICIGKDRFKIKHLQTAVEDGVNHGRVPKVVPFYPILSQISCRKIWNLFNLRPFIAPNKLQQNLSVNLLVMYAEHFYENAWTIFKEISERNDNFMEELSSTYQTGDNGHSNVQPKFRSIHYDKHQLVFRECNEKNGEIPQKYQQMNKMGKYDREFKSRLHFSRRKKEYQPQNPDLLFNREVYTGTKNNKNDEPVNDDTSIKNTVQIKHSGQSFAVNTPEEQPLSSNELNNLNNKIAQLEDALADIQNERKHIRCSLVTLDQCKVNFEKDVAEFEQSKSSDIRKIRNLIKKELCSIRTNEAQVAAIIDHSDSEQQNTQDAEIHQHKLNLMIKEYELKERMWKAEEGALQEKVQALENEYELIKSRLKVLEDEKQKPITSAVILDSLNKHDLNSNDKMCLSKNLFRCDKPLAELKSGYEKQRNRICRYSDTSLW